MPAQIGLTPDGRWAVETPELVRMTAEAGFTSLGIPARDVDGSVRAAYDAAGLGCHEVMALMVTDDEAATLDMAAQVVEAAVAMRAPWINTVFRVQPTGAAAALIARCAAMFAEAGSAMAVEFSPIGTLGTIDVGLEVVEIAGSGAGLMIDTWHFTVGGSTFEQLGAVPVEKIAYVQFSDGREPVSDDLMDETMNHRSMPGDGTLPLGRFASTLLERGFDGVVSVEVLSAELGRLPLPEFLRRAHDATAVFWR